MDQVRVQWLGDRGSSSRDFCVCHCIHTNRDMNPASYKRHAWVKHVGRETDRSSQISILMLVTIYLPHFVVMASWLVK
jgi:hypothetical protein